MHGADGGEGGQLAVAALIAAALNVGLSDDQMAVSPINAPYASFINEENEVRGKAHLLN